MPMLTAEQRAKELAQFFGMSEADALAKLNLGFGYHHAEVTADWKRANPQTDDEILEWYRQTPAYVWELSAYHLDERFNYMGMCQGISEALRAKGVERVLCLGDGVGDLTIHLREAGLHAVYHDLGGSKTANFAEHVWRSSGGAGWYSVLSYDWSPSAIGHVPEWRYDAIVSLDYLEHVIAPDDWLRAIYAALKPGGWFLGQHAFGIGSTKDGGSMPMHLDRNDRFETEYGPLMLEIGFVQEGTSNWWRRPA
jgi:SAM-dependent methyltransferase